MVMVENCPSEDLHFTSGSNEQPDTVEKSEQETQKTTMGDDGGDGTDTRVIRLPYTVVQL